MAFLAKRQLDNALIVQCTSIYGHARIADWFVIDTYGATFNVTAGFAISRAEFGQNHQRQNPDAAVQRCLVNADCRKIFRQFAILKSLAGCFCGFIGRITTMKHGRYFRREDFLRFVDFDAFERCQLGDFVQRKRRVDFRKRSTSASSVLRQYCQKS